jgi:hypothetical protein
MAKQVSNSEKSKWHSLRNALSLLGSVYSAILLIGLLASLLVQIIPVLENPIAIEVARLFTVMFASVLVSYVAIRQVGKGISRRLEKENLELREYFSALNSILVYDMKISTYITHLVSDPHERRLDVFDYVIRQMKSKEEKLKEIASQTQKYPSLLTLPTEGSVGAIVEISSEWDIPFQELAHYLCWKLGKDEARRLVPTDKILQCYGKDEVSMWNSIIK